MVVSIDCVFQQMERRRPAQQDICPLRSKSLRADGETVLFKVDRNTLMASGPRTGSSTGNRPEEEGTPASGDTVLNCDHTMTFEHGGCCLNKVRLNSPVEALTSEDELGRLDVDLDRKSKQHNLTSSNVRAILHVSICHQQVTCHTHEKRFLCV